MTAYEDTQWDKDYRRAYAAVLAKTGSTEAAGEAGQNYADTAADLRGQLVLRECKGEWDWEAGPFCSATSYPSQAAAAADFETNIFDLVEF